MRLRAAGFAAAWLALLAMAACPWRGGNRTAPEPPSAFPSMLPEKPAILPASLSRDFTLAGKVERFSSGTLWEKIDGGADLYLSYGFRELLFANYARPKASLPEIEVSVYDMGGDLNAMGVYLAEKPERATTISLGWEGRRTEDGVFFHKGSYYVKIADLSDAAALGEIALDAARHIDGAIRVERRRVAEIDAFPREGLVPGSVTYIQRDALGHGFLQRVFKADYTIEGQAAALFFTRQKAARALLAPYRRYATEFGRIDREWQAGGLDLIALHAFDKPEIVFARDDLFGGVQGCPNEEAAFRLIRRLLANIDRQIGKKE
jgi:hypothetical protein